MMILALLFRALPESLVPLAAKLLDLVFWYGSLALVYLMMGRLTSDIRARRLATVLAGLVPGSAYNATVGMESSLFGFAVLAAVLLATHEGGDLMLGVVLGLGCWLRPEGFVVALLLLLVRAWHAPSLRRSILTLIPLVLIAGALLFFHHHATGYWLPASGRARILAGQRESWALGPLSLSWKPLRLLAAYLPLSIGWLYGCWWIARRRLPSENRPILILAATISVTFIVLYSTVLGAAHLGRYLIFVMPFVVAIAVLAAQAWAASRSRALRVGALALASLWLAAVFAVEAFQRRALGLPSELTHAMRAPAERAHFSDHLEALLGHPTKRPIVLALHEVQLRDWLDDRFVVRSLDGRIDPLLLRYADGRRIDHVAYLRDRGVDFLLTSIDGLDALAVGESARVGGVSFLRLQGDPPSLPSIFRVER
jgi:hypothetical protein